MEHEILNTESIEERDCENCKHKINGMCEKWKCEFEAKEALPSMEELLARAEAKGRADERAKILKILKEEHYKFGYKSLVDAIEIIEQIGEKNDTI